MPEQVEVVADGGVDALVIPGGEQVEQGAAEHGERQGATGRALVAVVLGRRLAVG